MYGYALYIIPTESTRPYTWYKMSYNIITFVEFFHTGFIVWSDNTVAEATTMAGAPVSRGTYTIYPYLYNIQYKYKILSYLIKHTYTHLISFSCIIVVQYCYYYVHSRLQLNYTAGELNGNFWRLCQKSKLLSEL